MVEESNDPEKQASSNAGSSSRRHQTSSNNTGAASPTSYGAVEDDADDDVDTTERAQMFLQARRLSSQYLSFSQPGYGRLVGGEDEERGPGFFLSLRHSYKMSIRETVSSVLHFPGMVCSVREMEGKATVPNEILNLVKNIVGAGALALPSGVAALGNAPSVLIPASVWLIVMAAIFAYYFLLIGRTCKMSRTASYAEAWEHTHGEAGAGLVALAVALKAGMGNLECSMILADSARDLFATAGVSIPRSGALLLVTVVALLPLCLLKNLAVLAPFSMAGLVAMLFTAFAIAVRYFDGSYDVNQSGRFLSDIPPEMQPSFGSVGAMGAFHLQVLLLLCMISEAYIAHYNAPRFWVELKGKTVPRFGAVVGYSFAISALYYVFVTVFGFLTFGQNASGFILDNYSTNDILASISRSCVGFSLIFTYPIIFMGFRDGMLDVLMVPKDLQTTQTLNVLTMILLAIITILAAILKDLGMVTAVGGGTLGSVVVFLVPSVMFRSAVKRLGDRATAHQKREVYFATGLMWLGIFIGVVGVYIALQK